MIKANELRLGNLYDNNGNYSVVTPSTIESVFESERVWCKPIPLTEELLLKCGAKTGCGETFKIGEITIMIRNGKIVPITNVTHGYTWINGKLIYNKTIYLHQLQNLYFALCGEELKINL
jgi:hypothetical protein